MYPPPDTQYFIPYELSMLF